MLLYHMYFLITSKNSDITITPLLKATDVILSPAERSSLTW